MNAVDQFGRFTASVDRASNYAALLKADPAFRGGVPGAPMIWTIAIVGITTIIALFLAVALQQKVQEAAALTRALLLLPWATGLVIVSLLWRWMAHPDSAPSGTS